MPIKITVTPLDGGISFEQTILSDVVTLGRDKECDIHLHDEQRTLSRRHLRLENRGASLQITVLSTVNAVMVQGQELGPQQSMTAPADIEIEMQPFRVRAEVITQHQATPPAAGNFDWFKMQSQDAVSPPIPGAISLSQHLPYPHRKRQAETMNNEHPFADFIAEPHLAHPPAPLARTFGDLSQTMELAGQDMCLSDSFALPPRYTAVPAPEQLDPALKPLPPQGGAPFSHPDSTSGTGGLDSWIDGTTPPLSKCASSSFDHVHDFNLPFTPPPLSSASTPRNADFGYGSVESPLPGPVTPGHASEGDSGFSHPPKQLSNDSMALFCTTPMQPDSSSAGMQVKSPHALIQDIATCGSIGNPPQPSTNRMADAPAAGKQAAPPAHAPSSQPDQYALLQAFYDGLGIPVPHHLEDPEAQMRDAGEMLREAVHGIVGLLMVRAGMKKQIRTEDRTILATRDNNPMKMMDNPQDALNYLCDPSRQLRGAFLSPVKAIADACTDLQRHNLGLIASTHAAIRSALHQLTPETIENKAGNRNMLQRLNRRARLWEIFMEEHEKITRDQNNIVERIIETDFSQVYSSYVNATRVD